MQLQRSECGFKRLKPHDTFVESQIIGEANRKVRELLLGKEHLIPSDLLESAHALVEHYDRWLQEFEALRGAEKSGDAPAFVFVGPHGFPFPSKAAKAFETRYAREFESLYGDRTTTAPKPA